MKPCRCVACIVKPLYARDPRTQEEMDWEWAREVWSAHGLTMRIQQLTYLQGITREEALQRARVSSGSRTSDVYTTRVVFLPLLRLENLLPFPVTIRLYRQGQPQPILGDNTTAVGPQSTLARRVPPASSTPVASLLPEEREPALGPAFMAVSLLPGAQQDVTFVPSTASAAVGKPLLASLRFDAPSAYASLGWSRVLSGWIGAGGMSQMNNWM
jgi:hypothetical protein